MRKIFAFVYICMLVFLPFKHAIAEEGGFSLQVTPSPLIGTITPGEVSELTLKIRNTSSEEQNLSMGLKGFTVSDKGDIAFTDSEPSEVKDIVTFKEKDFTLEAGKWYDQKIIINTPKDAGFSYSFATMISRKTAQQSPSGGAAIEGSIAVFTLLSVDRPDATRKLDLVEIKSSKRMYEFLPATFDITLKNTGNTLVQPKGSLYIGRDSASSSSISVLQFNQSGGYMIPGSTRTFDMEWNDGFPRYVDNGDNTKKGLEWNLGSLGKLRIGKYTAKVIVVYDDGQRDIPIEAEVSFWVIPWKILGVILLLAILLGVGVFVTVGKSRLLFSRKRKKQKAKSNP